MKANELRIGNKVYDNLHNRITEIKAIDIYNCSINEELFKPIILTEEWLIKAGFKYYESDDWYIYESKKGVSLSFDKNRVCYYFGSLECVWVDILSEIKYVDQLQNLYYALTGEELTI